MNQIRKRVTYANVMSSIAVFLVLGGGAAFAALGKNTVGTPQLKRNAVKVGKIAGEAVKAGKLAKNSVATNRLREGVVSTAKLADLAVTAGKLANFAVIGDKLAADAVTNSKIADGAVSSAKIGGEQVKAGNLNKTTQAVGAPVNIGNNSVAAASVSCPAGSAVLSGGGLPSNLKVVATASIQSGNGWVWAAFNVSGAPQTIRATALCLNG